ncbi:transposable element Tcb2 transposase [Trichonephila clavipes]|nr:transposable element Tcb2 transposase [Trichonephila clavipes]
MEWPARSPDLNPIEHLWDYLRREVAALNPPPRSLHELKQGLFCVWSSLPIPVIGKLEEGRTVTSVAAEFGITKSVVSRAWKAFQTTDTAVRKVGGGRLRTKTAGDDRYIILQVKRGRRQSASVIAQQLSTATGRQVSRFTVARRLHKGGLFARCPEHCLPLKVDHRRHRLQWCREHKNWTTVNGVVSSLRMRVGSVPEAILNAF